jgi:isopenicillin N synthase-like dioxygenase
MLTSIELRAGPNERTSYIMSGLTPTKLVSLTAPELPVVNLLQPLDEVGREFGKALASVGFVYVEAHGADEALSTAFAMLRAFFELSLDDKTQACSINRALRGYSPVGSENFASLAGAKRPNDTVEKFRVGPLAARPESSAPQSKAHAQFYFANAWPLAPAQLQSTVESLYAAMSLVAGRIAEGLASALGLPPTYFAERMRHPTSILTANHYPETTAAGGVSPTLRIEAHTDVSLFTLVAEQAHSGCCGGGLEVQVGDDVWLAALPKPGAFIVNIGDCLSDWSGGAFVSTVHRVALSPGGEDRLSRLSFAFFVTPDPDTSVDPRRLAADRRAVAASSSDRAMPADRNNQSSQPPSFLGAELTYCEWRIQRIKRAMLTLKNDAK